KSDAGGFTRCRINRSKEFADRRNHINGIGDFWNQAKRALRKYNGIDRKPFPPFLRECEFRFNFGTPSRQLKILRDRCGI
ncbi:transposase, partial [Neisseria gonorrhoeae]